jgi:predicted small integral membrane protein
MRNLRLFRFSQLLIIFPCALREWINFLTDIGQFEKSKALSLQIISFSTQQNASTLFNRAIDSPIIAKLAALSWIITHFITATLITYGLITLLINIKASRKKFNQKKIICFLGLSFGIFSYVFLVGFVSIDYFLAWMQNISLNSDLIGYSLPLIVALLYLTVNETKFEFE